MSESPSVRVAVGAQATSKLLQQDYDNISTEYNEGTASDSSFYNQIVHNSKMVTQIADDIYGFMPGAYDYTNTHSMGAIVDFFNKNKHIEMVICDIIIRTPVFDSILYTHPDAPKNIPFFVRQSMINGIEFDTTIEDAILQRQLEQLRAAGRILFHIAKPLLVQSQESDL